MKKWSIMIFGIVAMTSLVCLMSMGIVGAYDQDDLDRLLNTGSCSACDLSDANLFRADLSGANLFGVNLFATNLSGANLTGATWTDGRICAEGSIGQCN